MADNDFFVRFDSNADTWANKLASQLQPAAASIKAMYDALEKLDKATGKSRSDLSKALAAGADQQAPGYGKSLLDLQTGHLQSALDDQEQDLKKMTREVRDLSTSMHRAVEALAKIPGEVAGAVTRLHQATGQGVRSLEGRGPSRTTDGTFSSASGAIRDGSVQALVAQTLRTYERATGQSVTGSSNPYQQLADRFQRTGVPQHIGSIAQTSLDKAGIDRIVNAITSQTRTLQSAIANIKVTGPGTEGPGTGPAPTKTATKPAATVAAPDDATPDAVQALKTRMDALDKQRATANQLLEQLTSSLAARGDIDEATRSQIQTAIDQTKAQQAAATDERNALAAQLRKSEREATPGLTQAKQKEINQAAVAAERKAQEHITDVEKESRLRREGLIQQAAAGDFESRASKKAQNNDAISLSELQETRRTFEALGVAVKGVNASSGKGKLVPALQEAAAVFQKRYPEGHPDLATTGFSVDRTTKVGSRLAAMVGDVEPFAEAIADARRILRASDQSGGERITPASRRPVAWGGQDPGVFGTNTPKVTVGSQVINVPPSMIKGRATPGAAIGDSPDSIATRAAWEAAQQVLRLDPTRQLGPKGRAVQLAGSDPAFNPYDQTLQSELKRGASPEEQAKHEAVQTTLREIREATILLDKMGTDYHNIKRSLEHKRKEVAQLSAEADAILKSGGDPKAQADRIGSLNKEIGNLDKQLTNTKPHLRELFESATYQQGWRQREGISVPFVQSQRQLFQGRQNQTYDRNFTPWGDLHAGLGQALVGTRTTMGSRTQISPYPGLGFQRGKGLVGQDMDPKTVEALDKAMRGVVTAHAHYYRTISDADASTEDVAQAMDEIQQKANVLAARLDREFGYSNPIEELANPTRGGVATNVPITDPEILAAEADRQLRRDELRRRTEKKFEATPEMQKERLDQQAARLQKELLTLQERRKAASERIATSEERFGKAFAQLTPTQQDEFEAHKQAAALAKKRVAAIKKQLDALENIQYVQRPDNNEAFDPIHMLGLERPKGFEQASPDELRQHLFGQLSQATSDQFSSTAAARNVGSDTTVVGPKLTEDQISALRKQLTQLRRQATIAEKKSVEMEQELRQSITRKQTTPSGLEYSHVLTKDERHAVDTLGYDRRLGYAPSVQTQYEEGQAEIRAKEQEAIAKRQAAHDIERQLASGTAAQYDTARVPGLDSGLQTKAQRELDETEQEIAQLTAELARLGAEAGKLVPKISETGKKIRELRQERADLQELPHTKKERTAASNAGDQALFDEIDTRVKRIAEINHELQALGTSSKKAAKDTEQKTVSTKKEGDALKQVSAAANGRIRELLEERRLLRAQPYTRQERKDAYQAGDTKLYDEISARRTELARIKNELNTLGYERGSGAGGTGGGDGGGTTTGGGDDVGGGKDNRSLLSQILATLKAIHSTLKGTLKVSGIKVSVDKDGAVTATTVTRKPRTPAEPTVEGGVTAAQLEATRQLKRAEQEAAALAETARLKKRREAKEAKEGSKEIKDAINAASKAQEKAVADTEKANRALREQAHAEQLVASAMGRLSPTTLKQIDELRRLAAAAKAATTDEQKLAAQQKVAAQQRLVTGSLSKDLGNIPALDKRRLIQATLTDAGPEVSGKELDSILRTSAIESQARDAGRRAGQGMGDEALSGFARTFGGNSSFMARVMHTTGTFIVRNFAAGAVFGLTNALQVVLEQALQAEATFVRVSSALEAGGKETGNIRSDLQTISADYGVALNDTYTAAAALVGLFDNADDLAAGVKISTQLQVISGGALNAAEAVGVLSSTLSAFAVQDINDPLEQLRASEGELLPADKLKAGRQVADVLTNIQDTLGVNIETSAEGVSRMAGLAREMRLSFEETAVFTAQIAKQTNQTGAAAGEQFSRILSSLQTGRGRAVIEDTFGGTDAGAGITQALNVGDYGAAITELIKNWDGLSQSEQRNVAVTLAGQRQMAAFQALVSDSAKTMGALESAQNASGVASSRMEKIMKTLNNRVAQFSTQMQSLASNLIQTGILNFFGAILVTTNHLLDAINKVLNVFNKFADRNPVLGFLRDLGGFALGAIVSVKLLQAALRGLRAERLAQLGESTRASRLPADKLGYDKHLGYGANAVDATGRTRPKFFGEQSRSGGVLAGAIDRTILAPTASGFASLNKRVSETNRLYRDNNVHLSRFRRALQVTVDHLDRFSRSASDAARGQAHPIQAVRGWYGLDPASGGTSVSDRLAAAAERRREIYADQQRFAAAQQHEARGYTGDRPTTRFAQQLADEGKTWDQISQRMKAPQEGLLGTAKALDGASKAASGTGSAMGRLGSGLRNLASAGLLADLAIGALMGVLFAAIARAQAERERTKTLEEQFGEGQDKKTADEKAKEKQTPEYLYKEDRAINRDPLLGPVEGAKSYAGYLASPDKWLEGPAAFLSQDLEGLARNAQGEWEIAGASLADSYSKSMFAQIDSMSGSAEGLARTREEIDKKLTDKEAEITADSSLTSTQKTAAIAQLENVRQVMSNLIDTQIALVNGMADGVNLAFDQINKLDEISNLLVGTQNLAGMESLAPIFEDLISEIGGGDELTGLLTSMIDGQSTIGEVARAQGEIMRETIAQLSDELASADATGKTPEEIEAIRGKLISTLQAYATLEDSAVSAISQDAQLVADQLANEGDISGSQAAHAQAIRDIENFFEDKYGDLDRTAKQLDRMIRKIAKKAARLADKYGGGRGTFGPRFGAPEQPQAHTWEDLFTLPVDGPGKPNKEEEEKGNHARRRRDAAAIAHFRAMADLAIYKATRNITRQIAQTSDAALRASLEAQRARIERGIIVDLNAGEQVPGVSGERRYGPAAYSLQEVDDANNAYYQALTAYQDQQEQTAEQAAEEAAAAAAEARANRAALRQAHLGVAAAAADARGDAVAAARVQVAMAKAMIVAARADLAAAKTQSETAQARISILNAQAQLIGAHAAVQAAQQDLVQSQYDVSIALAEAAGKTVLVAQRQLAAARAALASALKKSHGKATAEVNQARAAAIAAEASLRDAKLQDDLDTIDFNLEMGRITQSSAIHALQEILRTRELTREQRRQLLLQIKGMKEEMADSQWNIGDIKLPTPYQMRRYIEERRGQFRNELNQAAGGSAPPRTGATPGNVTTHQTTVHNTFKINGADVQKVRQIIREVVGGSTSLNRTTGARRGR